MKNNEDWIINNIVKYRKLQGLKSELIAQEIGISQSEYSRLENGKKRNYFDLLVPLSSALNISFHDLVSKEGIVIENQGTFNDNSIENTAHTINLAQSRDELYEKIIEQKDVLINKLEKDIIMWQDKYKRMKDRFLTQN